MNFLASTRRGVSQATDASGRVAQLVEMAPRCFVWVVTNPWNPGLSPELLPDGRRRLSRQRDNGQFLCSAGGRFFVVFDSHPTVYRPHTSHTGHIPNPDASARLHRD